MRTLHLLMVLSLSLLCPSLSRADGFIFFDSPPLGQADRMVLDPYTHDGVTFTSLPDEGFASTLGLVRSNASMVCINSLDDGQMLGTAAASTLNVGAGWFAIRADFATPVVAPAFFQIGVQSVVLTNVKITLYDANNAEVGHETGDVANLFQGTCAVGGFPSNQSGIFYALSADEPVSYVIIDTEPDAVFVIDNFQWRDHAVPTEATTWGRVKALYRTSP